MYILDPSRRVQEIWLLSSEDPGVVILAARARPQSYQQVCIVALVAHILVDAVPTMALVVDLLLLYLSFADLESLVAATSQS